MSPRDYEAKEQQKVGDGPTPGASLGLHGAQVGRQGIHQALRDRAEELRRQAFALESLSHELPNYPMSEPAYRALFGLIYAKY